MPTKCWIKDAKRLKSFTSQTRVCYKRGESEVEWSQPLLQPHRGPCWERLSQCCAHCFLRCFTLWFLFIWAALLVHPDLSNTWRTHGVMTLYLFNLKNNEYSASFENITFGNKLTHLQKTNTPDCCHWQHLHCYSHADQQQVWVCLQQLKRITENKQYPLRI